MKTSDRKGEVRTCTAKGPNHPGPVCLDLFSGAGGFSEGFRQAGFHTVVATDIDPWAGATYELNHAKHGTKFILGDIANPRVQEPLFDIVGRRELDAIIGGPPCQGFSQVRNHARLIDDSRNRLYRHYVSVIRGLRPRTFVMENVPGLENLAEGAARSQILEDLTLEGDYRVESRVVDAAAFQSEWPRTLQDAPFQGHYAVTVKRSLFGVRMTQKSQR